MIALGLVGVAWPCAGIVHEQGLSAESPGAEVLFEPGGGSVTATFAVTLRGEVSDLGWVIPVPAVPTAVADGDLDRIGRLREASAPRVLERTEDHGGGGCLVQSYGLANDRAGAPPDDLQVLSEGFTGTYAYQVIAASSAAELGAWFDDNGWEGLAAADLDLYVAAGFAFVAVRVVPEAPDTLPPLSVTWPGDTMVYPAVMARHALSDQRTTLYVSADTRAVLSGWTSAEVARIEGASDADPTALWDARLAEVGQDRAYVATYAGDVEDRFLTRYDTLAPAALHDVDVVLTLADDTWGHTTEIALDPPEGRAAFLLAPLALLGAALRRGRAARTPSAPPTSAGAPTAPRRSR